MIDVSQFEALIREQINESVTNEVNKLLMTGEWSTQLKTQALAHVVRALKKELQNAEVDAKIREYVIELFNGLDVKGIDDRADSVELTVMNGAVVVEHDFVATNIQAVESIATETLAVRGDLVVRGSVNTDGRAWDNLKTAIEQKVTQNFENKSKEDLVNSVLDRAMNTGISFDQVRLNGKTIVRDNELGSSITESSLRTVGALKELTVLGEADFNNTVFVANKRLGVNTRDPSSALSVWDEEVEIAVGKRKERTGFIGTNRKQHLEIGVNGKGDITIKDDGLVVIKQLQVGKQRIGHDVEVPGYSGSKGDIVFNINVSPKNPVFAWMCVGWFNWVALAASIS